MNLLKRVLTAAASTLLCLAGLAACSSGTPAPKAGPGSGGASATIPLLRVGTTGGTSTLDPLTTQGCATDYCGLFMKRLMKFAPTGSLSRSWPPRSPSRTRPATSSTCGTGSRSGTATR